MKNETKPRQIPLSIYQKVFFLEWAIAPHEITYNISYINKLEGKLDNNALKSACSEFTSRNEIVHAQFSEDSTQCFYGNFTIDDFYIEVELKKNIPIEEQINQLQYQPFDLTKGPLLKIYLLNDTLNETYYFLFVTHHIICDAVWVIQFFSQIQNSYNRTVTKQNIVQQKLKTFSEAVILEQSLLENSVRNYAQNFWNKFIDDIPLKVDLLAISGKSLYDTTSNLDKSANFVYFDLTEDQSVKIRDLALRKKSSVFVMLSALYGLTLSKFTGQKKFLLNYPVNTRPSGYEEVVGCFVNNIVMKFELDKIETLTELIQYLTLQRENVKHYQNYTLSEILSDQRKNGRLDTENCFNVGFSQSFLNVIPFQLLEVNSSALDIAWSQNTVHDLSLLYDDRSKIIRFKLECRKNILEGALINEMVEGLLKTINDALNIDEFLLKRHKVISDESFNSIVYKWSNSNGSVKINSCVHYLFKEQVFRTPDAIAVTDLSSTLSYKSLDEKSDCLAHLIRKYYKKLTKNDLTPNILIPLCLGRSTEMVVGILGVMKAGAAYVPIDPHYPEERINYILEDTSAPFVLTDSAHQYLFSQEKQISIDLSEPFYLNKELAGRLPIVKAEDLAYVLYTSGTTGFPKGTMIEHRGIVNLVENQTPLFNIKECDIVLQFAAYVFDASVSEIFTCITTGAKLIIANDQVRKDVELLSDYLLDNFVNVATIPPALLAIIPYCNYPSLKTLVVAGETCSTEILTKWSQGRRLINAYGPTENTVCASMHMYKPGDSNDNIGKPIKNAYIYILDNDLNPVPVGVKGGIFIGGMGVARGYLNNENLTRESFITNPFISYTEGFQPNNRLYRTGDMARWCADGNIEFIGRDDNQVKIRGYRIELTEIERVLNRIPGIKRGFVIVKDRQENTISAKFLVAYYVPAKKNEVSESSVLKKLTKILPDYMVPALAIRLESFPLTINGKIDKRALPDPDNQQIINTDVFVSDTERLIMHVWADVLGKETINANDDFFRIGGDSILSILVSTRLRKMGFNCQVKDIFAHRTIKKLSLKLKKGTEAINIKREVGILSGALDLSPIQKWFVSNISSGSLRKPTHWNQSFLIRVPVCNIARLNSVLHDLISYHDVLRIYYSTGQNWDQYYSQDIYFTHLKTANVSHHNELEIQNILTEWQSHFCFEKGPLFQIGYLYGYEDGTARIFMAFHHMIIDAVSWRIITDDIKSLYEGHRLPQKGTSYRQWVECVRIYSMTHPDNQKFWETLSSCLPENRIDKLMTDTITKVSFKLDKITTERLLNNASKAYLTEINELLLTAFSYALYDIDSSNIYGITLEGHGREAIDLDVDHSRTVGWFTTIFPVIIDVKENIEQTIIGVKACLRAIPDKGLGFGPFITNSKSDLTYDILPLIHFNYLGQFDNSHEMWQVTTEDAGTAIHLLNNDKNLINSNGWISEGCLHFFVDSRLSNENSTKFITSFKQHIINIVCHCEEKLTRNGVSHTPEDFQLSKLDQSLLFELDDIAFSSKNEITHIYPANSLQRGFIYHALSQEYDDSYRLQLLYDYYENINIDLYLRAWKYCIEQFPILRTAFNWKDDLLQIVYTGGDLDVKFHDLSKYPSYKAKNDEIEIVRVSDRRLHFDLTKPTILRLHIFKNADNHFTTLLTQHHIIADGWSGPILLASLHKYYQLLCENRKILVVEDSAYLRTQEYIQIKANSVAKYWEKVAGSINEVTDVNPLLDYLIDTSSYRRVIEPSVISLDITGETYASIKSFSRSHGITTNVITLFLWHKLLQIFNNSKQTLVGTTVSGRDLPIDEIDKSVGLYINTLPLLLNWDNEHTIVSQLHYIQQQITDLNSHSFADLASMNQEGQRLFQSLYVFENYPVPRTESVNSLQATIRSYTDGIDYPLSIMAIEYSDQLVIKLKYDAKFLCSDKAQQHLEAMQRILTYVLNQSHECHNTICLLSRAEYQKIIYNWNNTDKLYSKSKTIHQLFEEQVARTPDRIAVIADGTEITYQKLNDLSNQLARYLTNQHTLRIGRPIGKDDLIAICMNRSVELVISILGILKAGGAYVPIDTAYPQERLDYILSNTKAELILTLRNCSCVDLPSAKVVYADLDEGFYQCEIKDNLSIIYNATDLAYVIFTSGTTGKPKGSLIEHHSLVNLNRWYIDEFNLSQNEVTIVCTEACFDLTQKNYMSPLITGCTVVIPASGYDPSSIASIILDKKIKRINCTPSAFKPILEAIYEVKYNYSFDYIFLGGEPIPDKLVKMLHQHSLNGSLINTYGPTECSDVTTFYTKSFVDFQDPKIPLGKPVDNFKHYVLDKKLVPVPIGVTGELYISGAGVGRGYLNNEELTRERFINNPFATEADQKKGYNRIYKTGDLVRWLPSGNLEYVGRNDDQVKIRGYRIELGEIENVMSNIPGVKQSCVLIRERQTQLEVIKYLVGYYVLEPGYVPDNNENILNNWENIYDTEYEKSLFDNKLDSDFTGWNSYITGEPFSIVEMNSWRNDIILKIKTLNLDNVLEVGVGTGLLMYPLLNHVYKYTGLDISKIIIQRHKNELSDKGFNVDFFHLKADELDQLPKDELFSTIIINSVCQYFPNVNYFELVLNKMLDKLTPGGSIFLGDLRNYDMEAELIKEMLIYKYGHWTHSEIERVMHKGSELLVSPRYFADLSKRYTNLSIKLHERNGSYNNELSKYRYDVTISGMNQPNKVQIDTDYFTSITSRYFNTPFINQLSRNEITIKLSEVLPEYMVPSTLIMLESFPLTVNGKLDKRALPDSEDNLSTVFDPPTTENEALLCKLWEELLSVLRVGLTDDFFVLGGNSILAIKAAHRMTIALGREVKVTELFLFRNIKTILFNQTSNDDRKENVEWEF